MYQLFRDDCLAVLPTLDAGSIDLTITSPPYDNLRIYSEGFDADTFNWRGILQELYRVTKPGGVVVWVVADATIDGSETGTSFRQALWAMECGFNLHDTMIWAKPRMVTPTPDRYYAAFEYMFVLSKGQPKATNLLTDRRNISAGRRFRKGHIGAEKRTYNGKWGVTGTYSRRFNVWTMQPHDQEILHVAVFPEALARDHILSWSNPGDTVLDPLMGSGTTGKMAMLTGRRFIGIEISQEYMAISEKRIADAARQARGEFRTIQDTAPHDDLPLFAIRD